MNEQQHLEEVIGRFLQNTRENEEISKEEAIYLKRRIRPAMEYLIVQENIDGMKKMADSNNNFKSTVEALFKGMDAVVSSNGMPSVYCWRGRTIFQQKKNLRIQRRNRS